MPPTSVSYEMDDIDEEYCLLCQVVNYQFFFASVVSPNTLAVDYHAF